MHGDIPIYLVSGLFMWKDERRKGGREVLPFARELEPVG